MPVSVAGIESFSKRKIIKTCLPTSVSDETLSSLADLGMENNIARNLNFSELVESFADVEAGKASFHYSIVTHFPTFCSCSVQGKHNTINFCR